MFVYIKRIIYKSINKFIEERAILLSDEKLSEKIDLCYKKEEFFNDKRAGEVKYIYLEEFYRRKMLCRNIKENAIKFS